MIRLTTYTLLAIISTLLLTACSESDELGKDNTDIVELADILPTMTRTVDVAELKDYVGKSEFDNNDRAVFTTIKRTSNPIGQFTYSNLEFICAASTTEGVTSIGWSRDKNTGTIADGAAETHPDRIYWSDATNPHTFIGFCAPQQGGGNAFDWTKNNDAYYGSIGDPTVYDEAPEHADHIIDYRSTYDSDGNETLSGNVELCKNDILLTHSTEVTAQDAIAKLYFYHGLAQVRVIVNISDFAAGGGDDIKSTVSNMILKDMLTMYKWRMTGVATEQLNDGDQPALNTIYSSNTPRYDQRKDFNLWIPNPQGIGDKASRTFTFYGMAVPTAIPAIDATHPGLSFSFKVEYPNPMKPTEMKEHTYNASIGGIHFDAGKCTTINISLNHKNEKLTVGAEYDDWDFIDTPDQGELKKNSTFLTTTERNKITIIGDEHATADDATWLYIDATSKKIVDIYGNDGTEAHPFQISTADQLLSFAYEVKGTSRTTTTYKGLDNADHTLSDGFNFTGYYVKLDAGITLQATEKKTQKELLLQNPNIDTSSSEYTNAPSTILSWIGIGETDKPFNGNFQGDVRLISRLYGKPFFTKLGPNAHVCQLILESVIEIEGDGGFAEVNEGTICACKVDGNVKSNTTNEPVGSIVGTNYGLIFACYHTGDLEAEGASIVGGLVGSNNDDAKIVASYNYGKITANGTYKYGVLGQNNASNPSVFGCFYDHSKASNVSAVAPDDATTTDFPSQPKTTADIMRSSFTGDKESTDNNSLNGIINKWVTNNVPEPLKTHLRNHYYVSQPATYPYVY